MKVTYNKEMREKAKQAGQGLVTIDIVRPEGGRSTLQLRASAQVLHYAQCAYEHILRMVKT